MRVERERARLHQTGDLSSASVEAFVRAFEDCTLPRGRWDHGMHLAVGLWYVLHHGPERACALMSDGIRRYNAATGRNPSERSGFCARTTRTWILRIAHFARRHAGLRPEGALFRRILSGPFCRCTGEGANTWSGGCLVDTMARSNLEEEADVPTGKDEVTRLLAAGSRGEDVVRDLFGLVYGELCAIAERRMQSERAGHTLQATALVHEAYARLVHDTDMEWTSRRHFFGAAAQAMRRILVDHARRVRARRSGGDLARMTLNAEELEGGTDPDRMLALDDALSRLEQEDARAAEVVRLRFFAGLDLEDTARALDLSIRTVTREWRFARARLYQLLS